MSDTEPGRLLTRDIDPDDLRRFRRAVTRRKTSMQAAVRAYIHSVAEDERRAERAEMLATARADAARPQIAVDVLTAGLDADRAEWNGRS